MNKNKVFVLLFFVTLVSFSQQKNINSYKYVIVPDKFDFLKTSDQYQTSSLLKFLLEKKGFVVFLSNDTSLPKELLVNNCLALKASVIDKSSIFTIKSIIELKDCYNKTIYTSEVGTSKQKEYKKSYHEAIRKAYASMKNLDYKYIADKDLTTKPTITLPIKEVVSENATKEIKVVNSLEIGMLIETTKLSNSIETLYAQKNSTGFQIVDTIPTIIFQVLNTNVNDVFILKDKNGILYKKEKVWVAEYYENNEFVIKKYTIKF
ncbi:hypothetical protein [uncultured Polaribacter sp.]|uniref:hypothetical protein n=1 Tax=uncultured Polaribacter sp. TaxID=174711 RepID=UPI002614DE50|nr:hypothetical protein [uncultured Polaribacter sp.]